MSEQNKQPNTNKQVAMREEHIGSVMKKVNALAGRGELDIPPNYSVGNALNAAWLILQDVVDKDKQPALQVCTKESIGYSLLKMTIQGLNPAKDQCYFVVYGNKLALQRSYFGTVAVLKRVDPRVEDVVTEVVYQGDKLKYKLVRGKKIITDHEQSLENINDDKVSAAYCTVYDHDGIELASNIMTMAELIQSWKQSRSYPVADDGKLKSSSTHAKFTGQMAKKTVLNRTCKMLISSSDDSTILGKTVRQTLDDIDEAEAEEEIKQLANQEVIDVEVVPVQESAPVNGGAQPADGTHNAEPTRGTAAAEAGPGF